MAVSTLTSDIDTIFTTTLQLIRKRLADNIFKQNPLTFWLLARGRVKIESGGLDIREPIIYALNPTVKSYTAFDRFNVTPSEELTEAIFNWKQKVGTVSVSGLQAVIQNAGPQQVFNIVRAKVDVLEKTMREDLNKDMLKTGTRNSKEFLGLDTFIEQGSFGTVGNINGNTNTWWRNQWDGTAVGTDIFNELRTMYHNTSKGGRRADLILTPQALFERYEREVVGPGASGGTTGEHTMLHFTDTRLADVGFDNLAFKGATMMWDEFMEDTSIRAGTDDDKIIYFIDSGSLSLTVHRSRNFAMRPFMTPYDQDARVAAVLLAGNLTSNNRRNLGGIEFQST